MDTSAASPPWLARPPARWKARLGYGAVWGALVVAAYLRFDAGAGGVARMIVLAVAAVLAAAWVAFVLRRAPAIERQLERPETRAAFEHYVLQSKREEWQRLRAHGPIGYVWRVGARYMFLLLPVSYALLVLIAPGDLLSPLASRGLPQAVGWLLVLAVVTAGLCVWWARLSWHRAAAGWAALDASRNAPPA